MSKILKQYGLEGRMHTQLCGLVNLCYFFIKLVLNCCERETHPLCEKDRKEVNLVRKKSVRDVCLFGTPI